MGKAGTLIAGIAETAVGVATGNPALIEMGVGTTIAGIEILLAGTPPGHGVSSTNPIKAWDVVYGQMKVPGTVVYDESNGGILSNGSNTYDKCFQAVYMLACHPIKSIDQVRMAGKELPLGPGGSGALSTEWTFTPSTNQGKTFITSASRLNGVVTIKLNSDLLIGENGQTLSVQYVADNTFNGQWIVTQPNPADNTTFTYQCGGPDTTTTTSGAFVLTCLPDYKNRIHVDRTSCLGNHTSTFPELLSNSSIWTAAHKNLGRASCYIAYYYDANVFQDGIPQSSFVISGKNDIYDPRLGDITNPAAHIFTTNSALIIADYLSNSAWGYGLTYGTDIPLPQLIAAANICDEQIPLAAGGTEARYTTNTSFSLDQSRGAVLQDMLGACAGRISNQSGQWIIFPGAWVTPSLNLTVDNLVGPIEYAPILTITDSCNGVKGTYTSPINNWQGGDIPMYAEDELHGYTAGDKWLAADGGVRIWKDVNFPATTSCPTAQRLAKITLERIRREGRLTLHCDMSAWTAVALDVIEFTYAPFEWVNKTFEVTSSTQTSNSDGNGGPPVPGIDLVLAETDSDVYDWSTSEELTPNDSPSPAINNGQVVIGPQTLIIASGPSTTYVGEDGIALPRIEASWEVSPDSAVQSGGYVVVEYQKEGDAFWTPAGSVSGTQTTCFIGGVVAGQNYSVQVQAFTAKGVSSSWAQAGPITVSATQTFMSASNVTYPDGTPVGDLQPATAGADATALQPLAYTGISANLIPNGSFILGNIQGWEGTGIYLVGIHGGGIYLHGDTKAISPTFNVIPGQHYRFAFTGFQSVVGTEIVYHRIYYGSQYAQNIDDSPVPGYIGLLDFMSGGAITTSLDTYTYDWTCPSGVYFASLGILQQGTAELSYTVVSAQDYGAAAQWGADQTLTNTAAGIVGQGALATKNQTNTVDIVENAVSANVVAQSSAQQIVTANGTEIVVAQATITAGGGFVEISAAMALAAGVPAIPTITLWKGAAGGEILDRASSIGVAQTNVTDNVAVSLMAIDDSAGLSQQYTVTVNAGFTTTVYCNYIWLIIKNFKV